MKPLVAITMGDPAGVGPEIIAASWSDDALHDLCRAVVIGHPDWMRRAVQHVEADIRVVPVEAVDQASSSHRTMPCLQSSTDRVLDVPAGQVDARGGQAAYDAVIYACRLASAGEVDAITTAPLSKIALAAAGHDYPGHTELLAEQCGAHNVAMMLYLAAGDAIHSPAGLGVAHATLHAAMRDVFERLSEQRILNTAWLLHVVMSALMADRVERAGPRIGVCALNPHAGEQQLFGDEEVRLIEPAVRRGRAQGLQLDGPLAADALFAQAAAGHYDAVVAMYHDQGHIALKLLGMHRAVNVTLGLPIVRTSVAHGTAFDLAWSDRAARWDGMIEAIRVAARLVQHKTRLAWVNRTQEPA